MPLSGGFGKGPIGKTGIKDPEYPLTWPPALWFRGPMDSTPHYTWVDTPDKLAEAGAVITRAPILALDTEYDSFRYFRDRLCLIQIEACGRVFFVDPLGGLDLSFLGRPFASPGVIKILHAGDNDLRLLKRDYGFVFRGVFDTQRAASLLAQPRLSLAGLLEDALGLELAKEKKTQRSRWDQRPLTERQLVYAAEDVVHLPALYRRLKGELERQGKTAQAREAFAALTRVIWQERVWDPRASDRIKGASDLDPEGRDRLRRLCAWRFEKARGSNRPPFMIAPDEALLDLARGASGNPPAPGRERIPRAYQAELALLLAGEQREFPGDH